MMDDLELPYLTDAEAHARVEESGKSLDYIDAKTGQSCHIEVESGDVADGQEHPGTGELGGEEQPVV